MLRRAPAPLPDLQALFASLSAFPHYLLAVSGGPDSMALLALADEWRRAGGASLAVATVDHGLRPTSRDEAEAVAAACAARGLDHAILTWTGDKPAAGLPAAARAARYRLLADHARAVGAAAIVTAHHADDQAETVLMRLTRGSGPAGLAGMSENAPVPGEPGDGLRLLRPLLAIPKAALVAFCRARGIPYFEDPTNADESLRRPQIRRLATILAAEGLGRDEILRLAARAGRAERALEALVAERLAALPADRACGRFETAAEDFADLPEEARVRLLGAEIARLSTAAPPRLEQIEDAERRLRGQNRAALTLAGVAVRLERGRLAMRPAPARRTQTRRI